MPLNTYQTIRCFILVKAYPQPSAKYRETVCVAAISDDGRRLLRLYPIRYRHLPTDKKFQRFDLLEMRVARADKDDRPESFKVDEASINILEAGRTATAASKARVWLNLVYTGGINDLKEEQKQSQKSLAIIKPNEGSIKFYYKKAVEAAPEDLDFLKTAQAQNSLFETNDLTPLEPLEYVFYMRFTSGDPAKKHDMQIHDWEVQQTFRSYKKQYGGVQAALDKMEQFYGSDLLSMNPHFIMGNLGSRPYQFMIIGILRTSAHFVQQQSSLF